tara:strand:- start:228 stop:467 length:240 start_codon:yes stop_codon:yes gene_type:complete
MTQTRTINGTYGSGLTPCQVFIHKQNGLTWYAVEDSMYVNATYETLEDGVDVEMVDDVDAFTWSDKINSEDELINAVES